MIKTGIIYKFECLDTHKCYIGQTTRPKQRHKEHILAALSSDSNHPFYKDFREYKNWTYQVLEKDIPKEELDEAEIYYIDLFDSYNNGYNLRKGGGGWGTSVNISEHHKEALKKSWTDERRKKASETQHISLSNYYKSERGKITAKKHSDILKGRKLSDISKLHMSESHKGHITTQETKDKISKANKGRKLSDISKLHMSESHKGKSPGNKGKHMVWNEDHTKFHYE